MRRIPYAGAERNNRAWSQEEIALAASMKASGYNYDEIADAILDRFERVCCKSNISLVLRSAKAMGMLQAGA
jgi:hypothetical protein